MALTVGAFFIAFLGNILRCCVESSEEEDHDEIITERAGSDGNKAKPNEAVNRKNRRVDENILADLKL